MSGAENERRVNAMRGRSHVTAEWKAWVRSLYARDLSGKAVAIEVGISDNTAARWAYALGFRHMYVTEEERKHLLARRATHA